MNKILSIFRKMQNDSNLLVPIKNINNNAQIAIDTLVQIIDSVNEGSFKTFVEKSVNYHVKVIGSTTSTIVVGIDTQEICSAFYGLTENSIVYTLHLKNDTSNYYIGSASNAINRIGQHFDSLQGLRNKDNIHKKLLSQGTIDQVCFSKVYSSINYYKFAIESIPYYQFSQGEIIILRAITEFIIRILEQSLISEFSPSYNKANYVVFTYTS